MTPDERLAEIEADLPHVHRPDGVWLVEQLRDARAENERHGECVGCDYRNGPEEFCPRHGRTYNDLLDIMDRIGVDRDAERKRADRAEAALAAVRELVADLAEYGTRADLMPTVMFGDESHVYRQLTRYMERVDTSLRERARAALAAAEQDEPKSACSTCDGSGAVLMEHQIGVPGSGGWISCPDCRPTPCVPVSQPTERSEQ